MTISCFCQQLPSFSQAIDPTELDLESIYFHLDTVGNHRKPVRISFLQAEFPDHNSLSIETYFQRSNKHKLLRLGSYHIIPGQLFVMAEGWGTTYLKISDQYCTVVTGLVMGAVQNDLILLERKCVY